MFGVGLAVFAAVLLAEAFADKPERDALEAQACEAVARLEGLQDQARGGGALRDAEKGAVLFSAENAISAWRRWAD